MAIKSSTEISKENKTSSAYEWESNKSVAYNVQKQKYVHQKIAKMLRGKWEQRTGSQRGVETNMAARLARIAGLERTANFIDLFLVDAEKQRKKREAKEKKEPQEKQPREKGGDTTSRRTTARILGTLREIRQETIATQIAVGEVASDVSDIKSMLMPKTVQIQGTSGKQRTVSFNPLAPADNQFQDVSPKGALTYKKLSKKDKENASRRAALETAKVVLKVMEKEKKKEDLRKKYVYKDPKESDQRIKQDPVLAFLFKLDKRLDKIEELLGEGGVGGGGVAKTVQDLATGAALGTLAAALAGSLGPLLLAALPLAFMYKFAKWAEEADMNNPGSNPLAIMAVWGKKRADEYNDAVGNTKKWKEREEANARAGRTRGGVASSKGLSLDETIAHYDQMAKDSKATEQQREAAARVRDTLINQRMQRAAGAPVSKPEAPTTEQVSNIERDSDTWDTNYAQPSKPQRTTGRGEIRRAATPKTTISGEEDIKRQIKQHEGFEPEPYTDSRGYWTIGYGHLLSNKKSKEPPPEWRGRRISREEADALFEEDYKKHRDAAAKNIPNFDKLNNEGKKALIDLTFNMGPNWVKDKGFKRFEKAMSQPIPDLEKAAQSLEDSLWYRQVKGRGRTVVGELRAGLSPSSVGSVSPVTRVAGNVIDSDSRALQTTTSVQAPAPATTMIVNNQQNNNMGRRPAPPASTTSNDPSLVRTSLRDTVHPVNVG